MDQSVTFYTLSFDALTTDQLYALLALRSEVFVVEQNCVYQDIDYKDQQALHVLAYKEGDLIGYTRVFPPQTYFKEASIGRVIIKKSARGRNLGHQLMQESIQLIENQYKTTQIKISAQTYLLEFYNRLGFQQRGEEYLEDGIPHVAMFKS
ncbi:GNAT family N-acetyltransferase [Croceiramulus getboli]|nr:GNAT family N-acetyltransferase [Flavobacteriaceae bacterium YJPT1-3]